MFKKIAYYFGFAPLLFTVPSIAFADDLFDYIDVGIETLDNVIPVLITVASVVFMWGIVRFVAHAGDEKAVEEGKQVMVWGIISLFVLISFWGLVEFFQDGLGLDVDPFIDPITIPTTVP